jgi:hypothetical protein
MSENAAESSQTISSDPYIGQQQDFDQDSVNKCCKIIDEFKKGSVLKGEALLEIQSVLQAAIAESNTLSQEDLSPGFTHFLKLFDHAKDSEQRSNQPKAIFSNSPRHESSSRSVNEDPGNKEKELRSKLRRQTFTKKVESDESEDEYEYILQGKRSKLTSERLGFYPWLQPEKYHHLSIKRSEEYTLDCYEEWSEDSKYYRGQVTAMSGCPSFPLSQWTFLLEGRAPDLEKILSGHYSTIINPKQAQPLGKGFKIVLSQPTPTHKVKTYGDWSITTDLWIDALSFIMPWKESELRGYK